MYVFMDNKNFTGQMPSQPTARGTYYCM